MTHMRVACGSHTYLVSAGWEHTVFLTACGKVYTCGAGYKDSRRGRPPPVLGREGASQQRGQEKDLASKATGPCGVPLIVDGELSTKVTIHVGCGWDHCLAVTRDGSLYTWGSGMNGKLGHGDEEPRDVPTKVDFFAANSLKVHIAEAGCEHSACVDSLGDLYTWGHGDSGRLGHGDDKTHEPPAIQKTPKRVEHLVNTNQKVVSLAVGDKYNIILCRPNTSNTPPDRHVGTSPPMGTSRHPHLHTHKSELPLPTSPPVSPPLPFTMDWLRTNWCDDLLLYSPSSSTPLSTPLPRRAAAVAFLAQLERLSTSYLADLSPAEFSALAATALPSSFSSTSSDPPPLPPLYLTPNPVADPAAGLCGGFGDIYRYSRCSDSHLHSLSVHGSIDNKDAVASHTRIPFVADASARTLNLILSVICDVLDANPSDGTPPTFSLAATWPSFKRNPKLSPSFDANPALDSPYNQPNQPLSPPLTALSLADTGFAGDESAESLSMIELSNYIPPAADRSNTTRQSTAFHNTTASSSLSCSSHTPCHARFGTLNGRHADPSNSSLETLMEGDWSWFADTSSPPSDSSSVRVYDELLNGHLEGFRQLANPSSSVPKVAAAKVLQTLSSVNPDHDPKKPFDKLEVGIVSDFPATLVQWSSIFAAVRILQVNLRHILIHVQGRRALMEAARQELARRRSAKTATSATSATDAIPPPSFSEPTPAPASYTTVIPPPLSLPFLRKNDSSSKPASTATAIAPTPHPNSSALPNEPYFDQNDPSLQAAILNSLEESTGALTQYSVVNALGDAHPGGAIELAIKNKLLPKSPGFDSSRDPESMHVVIEELHSALRWMMYVPKTAGEDGATAPSVSDILGISEPTGTPRSPPESSQQATKLIAIEAIREQAFSTLSEGFPLFYPSVVHRICLLRELMYSSHFNNAVVNASSPKRVFHGDLRKILAKDLCRDEYISGVVDFAWNEQENHYYGTHHNPNKDGEESAVNVIAGVDYENTTLASITWTPMEVREIISKLLTCCSNEVSNMLPFDAAADSPDFSTTANSLSADLTLLISLQKHVMMFQQSHPNQLSNSNLTQRPNEIILKHALEMFTSARSLVNSAASILAATSDSDAPPLPPSTFISLGNKLSNSFLGVLLPMFCSNTVELRNSPAACLDDMLEFATNLLPSILSLSKSINNLNMLVQPEYSTNWSWLLRTESELVQLGTTLACELSSGPALTASEKRYKGWMNNSILFSHGSDNWENSPDFERADKNTGLANIKRLSEIVSSWRNTVFSASRASNGGTNGSIDGSSISPDPSLDLYPNADLHTPLDLTRPSSVASLEPLEEITYDKPINVPPIKSPPLPSLNNISTSTSTTDGERFVEDLLKGAGAAAAFDKWASSFIVPSNFSASSTTDEQIPVFSSPTSKNPLQHHHPSPISSTPTPSPPSTLETITELLEPARRHILALLVRSDKYLLQLVLTKVRLKPWVTETNHVMSSPIPNTERASSETNGIIPSTWKAVFLAVSNVALALLSGCDTLTDVIDKTQQTGARITKNVQALLTAYVFTAIDTHELVPDSSATPAPPSASTTPKPQAPAAAASKQEWTNSQANRRLRRWVRHHPRCNWTLLQSLCKSLFEMDMLDENSEPPALQLPGSDLFSSLMGNNPTSWRQRTPSTVEDEQMSLRELMAFLVGGAKDEGHDFCAIITALKTQTHRAKLRAVSLDVINSILSSSCLEQPLTQSVKIMRENLCVDASAPSFNGSCGSRLFKNEYSHPCDDLGGAGGLATNDVLVSYRGLLLNLGSLLESERGCNSISLRLELLGSLCMRIAPSTSIAAQISLVEQTDTPDVPWRQCVFDTVHDSKIVELLTTSLQSKGDVLSESCCRRTHAASFAAFKTLAHQLANNQLEKNSFNNSGGRSLSPSRASSSEQLFRPLSLSRNNSEGSLTGSLNNAPLVDSWNGCIDSVLMLIQAEMSRCHLRLERLAAARVIYGAGCSSSSSVFIANGSLQNFSSLSGSAIEILRGRKESVVQANGGALSIAETPGEGGGLGVSFWIRLSPELAASGSDERSEEEKKQLQEEEEFPWLKDKKSSASKSKKSNATHYGDQHSIPLLWALDDGESTNNEATSEDDVGEKKQFFQIFSKGETTTSSPSLFIKSHYPVASLVKDAAGDWRVQFVVQTTKKNAFLVGRGAKLDPSRFSSGSWTHVACSCEVGLAELSSANNSDSKAAEGKVHAQTAVPEYKLNVFYSGKLATEASSEQALFDGTEDMPKPLPPSFTAVEGLTVCDMMQHKKPLTLESAQALALSGAKSMTDIHHTAVDEYFCRLASLLLTVARRCSRAATALINSSEWAPLLLRSLAVAGAPARRAVFRVLRIVLPPASPSLSSLTQDLLAPTPADELGLVDRVATSNVNDENNINGGNSGDNSNENAFGSPERKKNGAIGLSPGSGSIAVGSGARAVAQRREGLRACSEYMCSLLGVAECMFTLSGGPQFTNENYALLLKRAEGGRITSTPQPTADNSCPLPGGDHNTAFAAINAVATSNLASTSYLFAASVGFSTQHDAVHGSSSASANANVLVSELTDLFRLLLRDGSGGWRDAIKQVFKTGLRKASNFSENRGESTAPVRHSMEDPFNVGVSIGPALAVLNVLTGVSCAGTVGSKVFVPAMSRVYDPVDALKVASRRKSSKRKADVKTNTAATTEEPSPASDTAATDEDLCLMITEKTYSATVVCVLDGSMNGSCVAILNDDQEFNPTLEGSGYSLKPMAVVLQNSVLRVFQESYHLSFQQASFFGGDDDVFKDLLPNILDATSKLINVLPIMHLGEPEESDEAQTEEGKEDDEREQVADLDELSAKCDLACVSAHVRLRSMKALSMLCLDPSFALLALERGLLPSILKLAATDVAISPYLALGRDFVTSAKSNLSRSLTKVISILSTASLQNNALQCVSEYVWLKLGDSSPIHRILGSRKNSANHTWKTGYDEKLAVLLNNKLEIEALGGKIEFGPSSKWLVKASSHFPTIQLSGVTIGVNPPTNDGMWYYEVTLESDGLMQIGWCSNKFECDPMRGQGVGDHAKSWAYDGLRKKKWNVTSEIYGRRWRVGDVIGSLLDVGRKQMRFFVNGEDMGLAFKDVNMEEVGGENTPLDGSGTDRMGGLRPAASLNTGQKAFFNFGQCKFRYPPDPAVFLKGSGTEGPNGNDVVRGVGEGILYASVTGGTNGGDENGALSSILGRLNSQSSQTATNSSLYVPTSNIIYDPFHAWRGGRTDATAETNLAHRGFVDLQALRETGGAHHSTAIDVGNFSVHNDRAGSSLDDMYSRDRNLGVALDMASRGFSSGGTDDNANALRRSVGSMHENVDVASGAALADGDVGGAAMMEMGDENEESNNNDIEDRNESSTPRNADMGNNDGTEGGSGASQQHGMQTEEEIDEIEAQRQILIENLIGMGFPIEWAIRASESMQPMNESLAIAWIIERMELEDGKVDGEEEEEEEGGVGGEEEGDDGEEGEDEEEGEGSDEDDTGGGEIVGAGDDEEEDDDDEDDEEEGDLGAADQYDDDDVSGYLQRLGFRDMTYDEGMGDAFTANGDAQGIAGISHESLSRAYGIGVGGNNDDDLGGEVVRRSATDDSASNGGSGVRSSLQAFVNEDLFEESLFPPSHLVQRDIAPLLEGSGASADQETEGAHDNTNATTATDSGTAAAALGGEEEGQNVPGGGSSGTGEVAPAKGSTKGNGVDSNDFPQRSDDQVGMLLELIRSSNPDEISEMALIIDTAATILCARSVVTSLLGHVLTVVGGVGDNETKSSSILDMAGWRIGLSRAPGICGGLSLTELPASLHASQPFGVLGIENQGWEDEGISLRSIGAMDVCGLSTKGNGKEDAVCKLFCQGIGSSTDIRKRFIDFMKLSLFREASDYQVGWNSSKLLLLAKRVEPSNCFGSSHNNHIRDIFHFVNNERCAYEDDESDLEGDAGVDSLEAGFRTLQWQGEDSGVKKIAWDDLFRSLDDDKKKQKLCRLQEMGGLLAVFARHAIEDDSSTDGDGDGLCGSFVEMLQVIIEEGVGGFEQILNDPMLDTEPWCLSGARSKAAGAKNTRMQSWYEICSHMGEATSSSRVAVSGMFGTSFGATVKADSPNVVSDSKSLSRPNLHFAAWALNLSMDFFDLMSSVAAAEDGEAKKIDSILTCSSQAFSARSLAALLNCSCNSRNISSRVLSLNLISRLVRTQRRRLEIDMLEGDGETAVSGKQAFNVIISTRHEQKLARLIAERVRREANFAPVVTVDPGKSKDCGLLHKKVFGVGSTGEGGWDFENGGASSNSSGNGNVFSFLDSSSTSTGAAPNAPETPAAADSTAVHAHPRGLGSSYMCGLVNVLSQFILIREKKKRALQLTRATGRASELVDGCIAGVVRVHVDEVRPGAVQISLEKIFDAMASTESGVELVTVEIRSYERLWDDMPVFGGRSGNPSPAASSSKRGSPVVGGGGGGGTVVGSWTLSSETIDRGREEEGEVGQGGEEQKGAAAAPALGRGKSRLFRKFTGLVADSSYMVLVTVAKTSGSAESGSLAFCTPTASIFALDPHACGPNLSLHGGTRGARRTVVNTANKRWSGVRALNGFREGVWRWDVTVDRCVSKNIFIGVGTDKAKLDNYVGSDRFGWGYLANKAVWHNKGKVRSYGELFKEGDVIGVRLDMDAGTCSFFRNGKTMGIAVEGLEGEVYPMFSMYNCGDCLTLGECKEERKEDASVGDEKRGKGSGHFGKNAQKGASFGTSGAVHLARKMADLVACLESFDACYEKEEHKVIRRVDKFDESTVGTFMLASSEGNETLRQTPRKESEKKCGTVKVNKSAGVDDFAVQGVAYVWARLSAGHRLHFVDEGVYDGGVMGAGGVVVDSGGVGSFAGFGQMAGDDVLVGGESEGGEVGTGVGSTCTLIGVARHCLWYVVRGGAGGAASFGGGAASADGVGETLASPCPRIVAYDGLEFGERCPGQSAGVGCWDRSSFVDMMANDNALIIKGGCNVKGGPDLWWEEDEEESVGGGSAVGGGGGDGGEDGGEEDEEVVGELWSGSESDGGLRYDAEKLKKLVDGRGLWTGALDAELVKWIEITAKWCHLATPSYLSRKDLMGCGGGGRSGVGVVVGDESVEEGDDSAGDEDSGGERGEAAEAILRREEALIQSIMSKQEGPSSDGDEGGRMEGEEKEEGVEGGASSVEGGEEESWMARAANNNNDEESIGGGSIDQMETLIAHNALKNLRAALREGRGDEAREPEGICPSLPSGISETFKPDEIFARVCLMIRLNELACSVLPVVGLGGSHGPASCVDNEYEPWALLGHSRCRLFGHVKERFRRKMCSISVSVKTSIEDRMEEIKMRRARTHTRSVNKGGGGKVPVNEVLDVLQHFRGDSGRLRRNNIWADDARWMCGSFGDFEDLLRGFVDDAQGDIGMFVRNADDLDIGSEGLVVNKNFAGINGVPACECFFFFGQVLGIALRNGVGLGGLNLNKIVWKVLTGVAVGREDFYMFDSGGAQVADILAQVENLGVDDDESFVSLLGGGIRRSRGGGGGGEDAVTVLEAKEMACRIRREGFQSIANQIQAIHSGICNVVPASGLVLYSSSELQELFRAGGGGGE